MQAIIQLVVDLLSMEDQREVEAKLKHLNYIHIGLDTNIRWGSILHRRERERERERVASQHAAERKRRLPSPFFPFLFLPALLSRLNSGSPYSVVARSKLTQFHQSRRVTNSFNSVCLL